MGVKRRIVGIACLLVPAGALFLIPQLLGTFHLELLSTYLLFALVALGLGLVWGYCGVLSIGHFLFFGAGAYVVALATTHLGGLSVGYLPLLVLGALLLAGLLGFLISYISFSLNLGELFVLVTISLAIVGEKVAMDQVKLFGGINGIILPYWVVPSDMRGFFQITVVVVTLVCLLLWLLTQSPFGKTMLAIKDTERRVQFLGYNTNLVKAIAFAISAAIAGLGGGLYAILTGFVSPTLLGFIHSFDAVVWVVVGGLGTVLGPLVGTIVVNIAKFYLSGFLLKYWILAIGLFFVLIVLFIPQGITGMALRRQKQSVKISLIGRMRNLRRRGCQESENAE